MQVSKSLNGLFYIIFTVRWNQGHCYLMQTKSCKIMFPTSWEVSADSRSPLNLYILNYTVIWCLYFELYLTLTINSISSLFEDANTMCILIHSVFQEKVSLSSLYSNMLTYLLSGQMLVSLNKYSLSSNIFAIQSGKVNDVFLLLLVTEFSQYEQWISLEEKNNRLQCISAFLGKIHSNVCICIFFPHQWHNTDMMSHWDKLCLERIARYFSGV